MPDSLPIVTLPACTMSSDESYIPDDGDRSSSFHSSPSEAESRWRDEETQPTLDTSMGEPEARQGPAQGRGERGRGRRGRAAGRRGRVAGRGGRGQAAETGEIGRPAGDRVSRTAARGGRARPGRRRMQDAEAQRVAAMLEERRVETEELLQALTLEEYREIGRELFAREPGLVFDALRMNQARNGAPPPADLPGVPWCLCGNCRDMPTLLERKCCGQEPNHCVRQLPHFILYCLDEGNLRIHRQYREDLMVVRPARDPGDDNREYRYAAYRHFIFWQHGALGQGNRLVIPSCCVWAIRDRYPDPFGQYAGFVPGR